MTERLVDVYTSNYVNDCDCNLQCGVTTYFVGTRECASRNQYHKVVTTNDN